MNSNRKIFDRLYGKIPKKQKENQYLHGYAARKDAGYPETLKSVMVEIAMDWDVMLSTRVGNPPRVDLPVSLATKSADIKTKTAPSTVEKGKHYITSPARGTIIKQQEIFGKEGSARVPDIADKTKFTFVPYPTTLRELFRYVDSGLLSKPKKIFENGKEYLSFEAQGDFKPIGRGKYDEKNKLHFDQTSFFEKSPVLHYRILVTDLTSEMIENIYPTTDDRRTLAPWLSLEETSLLAEADRTKRMTENNLLRKMELTEGSFDKPIPLYFYYDDHTSKPESKPIEVLALKDQPPKIIIGDDDTFSINPSLAFIRFLKNEIEIHNANNESKFDIADFLKTNGYFNADDKNIRMTALRLSYFQEWLLKYQSQMKSEKSPPFDRRTYMDSLIANKLGNIDSCGPDGMSIFELAYSLEVNRRFGQEVKDMDQFVQHPPEARNHNGPSALLNEKIMLINHGTFITTSNEFELISYYLSFNEFGNTFEEKYAVLAQNNVVVNEIWFNRGFDDGYHKEVKGSKFQLKSEGDFWWPIVAIQIALGQKNLMSEETYTEFIKYLENYEELHKEMSKSFIDLNIKPMLAIMKKNEALTPDEKERVSYAVQTHLAQLKKLYPKNQHLQNEFAELFPSRPLEVKQSSSSVTFFQSAAASSTEIADKAPANDAVHSSNKMAKTLKK